LTRNNPQSRKAVSKRSLGDSLSIHTAKVRRKAASSRFGRLLGPRGTVTVILGAALSLGGLTQAMDGVHFLVEKDLDAVRLVRQDAGEATVVASVKDGFAANSLFKLSRVLPTSLVSHQLALFDEEWMPQAAGVPSHMKHDVFHEEMYRINRAIRREFFAVAMPYGDLIHEKAAKYDVDPALVAAVIEQESKFRTRAHSQVGARGLMQLMPRTGRWMGARDLYDPEQNIDAGVRYIKYLQRRFDGNVKNTIAAYNAGEGNVQRYNGVPPFRETQQYVKKVMHNYARRNEELKRYGQEQHGSNVIHTDEGPLMTLR
jgi:hypothetical protein